MIENLNAPWSLDEYDHPNPKRRTATVYDDDSEIVAKLTGPNCFVLGQLLAASPDLIEAVMQWISERDSACPCWVMKQQAEKKMRAAIAKATGKEVES